MRFGRLLVCVIFLFLLCSHTYAMWAGPTYRMLFKHSDLILVVKVIEVKSVKPFKVRSVDWNEMETVFFVKAVVKGDYSEKVYHYKHKALDLAEGQGYLNYRGNDFRKEVGQFYMFFLERKNGVLRPAFAFNKFNMDDYAFIKLSGGLAVYEDGSLDDEDYVDNPLPQLQSHLIDKTKFDDSLLKKRVTLVHFWQSDKKESLAQAAVLKALQLRYKDNDAVGFVGVSLDKSEKDAEQFIQDNKMSWPQVYEEGKGFDNSVRKLLQIDEERLFDVWVLKDGIVQYISEYGDMSPADIDHLLESAPPANGKSN